MQLKIGIMQGRLTNFPDKIVQSFPKNNWGDEFEIAKKIGFDGIELIFNNKKNPLFSAAGVKKILFYSKKFKIETPSIIFDYFKVHPLLGPKKNENIKVIKKVIKFSKPLNIKSICIALIENNEITDYNQVKELVKILKQISNYAKKYNVIITLETSLSILNQLELLNKVNNKNLRVNFDTGNAIALGYDINQYIKLLGKFLYSVHIKDRGLLYSPNVALGKGDVNFKRFFNLIKKTNFSGYLIIEGARKKNLEKAAKDYLNYIRKLL